MLEVFSAFDISVVELLFLITTAGVAGFVDSVAGGGGLITMPALLLVGVPPHYTLGTTKFMSTLGTLAAFSYFAKQGKIVWKIVLLGVGFSLLGSYLGAKAVLVLDKAVLQKVLIFMLPIGIGAFFIPVRKGRATFQPSRFAFYLLTPFVFLVLGMYDGFFGPGTGTFLLLALYLVLGVGLVESSATAKPVNLASNIAALVVFMIGGTVFFPLAVLMAAANILGNLVGSRMVIAQGAEVVRKMVIVSLLLLFSFLVWEYYFK